MSTAFAASGSHSSPNNTPLRLPDGFPNSTGAGNGSDPRLRFARACDRCRHRKIKCDNEHPCGKCAAAGATCTSTMNKAGGNSRMKINKGTVADDSANHEPPLSEKTQSPASSSGRRNSVTGCKRKRLSVPSETAENIIPPSVLDHSATQHFFMSREGVTRFAGSTSGLPILETIRRLLQNKSDGQNQQNGMGEPDWSWLSALLEGGEGASSGRQASSVRKEESEDLEYFPGRDHVSEQNRGDIFASISEIIPPDLMAHLVHTFFAVVHPAWPIIHIQSFYSEFYKWTSYSFAALVVSMCMLATRYTDDPRALAEPGVPASAGLHFYRLFKTLREQASAEDNVIHAVQSLFFAAQYQCVDNVPHPIAQGMFAEAVARVLDGGLHREISDVALGDSLDKETRTVSPLWVSQLTGQRTAWACYNWDKQMSAIRGQPPLLRIWDYDVSLPETFEETEPTSTELPLDQDEKLVSIFVQQILLSVVLEKTLVSCIHHPKFNNSEILNRWTRSMRPVVEDMEALETSSAMLEGWHNELPATMSDRSLPGRLSSPFYSAEYEQLAIIEECVKMLIAARKLQLITLAQPQNNAGKRLEAARNDILVAGKLTLATAVKLGSSRLLSKCDILLGYHVLMTGRFLLASLLSARAGDNAKQEEEATQAVRAAVVLLRHFSEVFPVSLGAAEVLEETCRVCRVNILLPPSCGSPGQSPNNVYAWHRPVGFRQRRKGSERNSGHDDSHAETGPDEGAEAAVVSQFLDVEPGFASGSLALPFPEQMTDVEQTAFSWLLPGGSVPYYFPSET